LMENDGYENDGPSKFAGHENTAHENDGCQMTAANEISARKIVLTEITLQ